MPRDGNNTRDNDRDRRDSPASNPHDALVKALLENPERAGVLLRESLPDTVRARLADKPPRPLPGSFVDASLRESHSDYLYELELIGGGKALLYVLLEHKSAPDPATPLQLLGYQQRIWRRHAEQRGKGQTERYRNLPPILPLVLYHGRAEWTVPLSLLDCIDADDEILAVQSAFGYQVRHLRPEEPLEALSRDRVLRAALGTLARAFVERVPPEMLARLLEQLPDGHPLEQQLLRYIVQVYGTNETDLTRALHEARAERAEELKMTVAEEWMKQGRLEGHKQGRKDGEAEMLLRQLERKFGAEAAEACRERIAQADAETLLKWSEHILTAEEPEAVFRH